VRANADGVFGRDRQEKTKKGKHGAGQIDGKISYRLGGEAFRQVQRQAAAQGISVNDWCRQAVIDKLAGQRAQASQAPPGQGQAVTRGEQILLEEVLRTRYLFHYTIYHYLRTNKSGMSLDMFEHIVNQSNERAFQEWLEKWQKSRRWVKPAS
jgi:HicB family